MDLYDILACPSCKVALVRQDQTLVCLSCQRAYPIVNNVPVLLPDGSIPVTQHQHELHIRSGYDPWLHRVVLQSLPPSSIMLDMGAGNMNFSLPNLIRMDVTLTPYVDVVGDAHALPFLPGTFDFIFSLAVIEHLRQPFVAAQEMYTALRNGGYVYGECNFVFAYHGYPHHYFNASQQGLEQVFTSFTQLRSGVAPYQMPSFALQSVLETYRRDLGWQGEPDVSQLQVVLQQVLDQPLGTYDGRFSEEAALRTAAGVFFFGVKSHQGTSDVIPEAVQVAWRQTPQIQQRFPNMLDLGVADNIMLWAKAAGRQQDAEIARYFDDIVPFRKSDSVSDADRQVFGDLPVVEPEFGNIPDPKTDELTQRDSELQLREKERFSQLQQRVDSLEAMIKLKDQHITYLESLVKRFENGRVMRLLRLLK